MSGHLVGMVMDHGPEDHSAYSVALVIAEDMHHAGDTALFTLPALAARARLSVSSVQRGVRILTDGGWIHRQAGKGQGTASRYRLLVDRFPVEITGHTDQLRGLEDVGLTGHTDQLNGAFLVTQTNVPGHSDHLHRAVKAPSSSAPPEDTPPAAVLTTPADDDEAPATDLERAALADLGRPGEIHCPTTVRAMIRAAYAAGWTPATLNAHLRANWGNPERPMGLVRHLLAELPTAPAAEAEPIPEPDWCGQCDSPGYRWVLDGSGSPVRRCPRCNVNAPDYGSPTPTPVVGHQLTALMAFNGGRDDLDPADLLAAEVRLADDPVDDYDPERIAHTMAAWLGGSRRAAR